MKDSNTSTDSEISRMDSEAQRGIQPENSDQESDSKNEDLTIEIARLSEHFELNIKRVSVASIGVLLCCIVFLLVAGGRLASQVDFLQATTVSLAKRVVNMNSALEIMATFEQKLMTLDQGNAEILMEFSRFEEESREKRQNIVDTIEGLRNPVVSASDTSNEVVRAITLLERSSQQQAEHLATLGLRIDQLYQEFDNLKTLSSQVDLLIQIEKENLKELFEAQLELDRMGMETDAEGVTSDHRDEIISYPKK